MRAAKQEEKSQGTQHPIGHHQGYTRDTEHMGGATTFPQTISFSYAPTTPATMSSDTPMPETSQYQYYQQQVNEYSLLRLSTSIPHFPQVYNRVNFLCYFNPHFILFIAKSE